MSKKYIKKPMVIEAVQWKGSQESWDEIMSMGSINWSPGEMGSKSFYINTLEGKMKVSNGDYVIKGVEEEFYACKPSIFEKTYELINE